MSVRKSAKYIFIGNIISRTITVVGSIFLARILFPEDYGYLLMAAIFSSFIQLFGNMGFEYYYLQSKPKSEEEERKILNITYKLRVFTNGGLFLFQIVISYLAQWYYDAQIVGEMLRIYAISIPIAALTQVDIFILRKKLDYRPETIANISKDIFDVSFKILFALMGLGALSFAYASVIASIVKLLVMRRFVRFKPNLFEKDREIYNRIFFFGKHFMIAGISGFASRYIDKFILTTTYSPELIGGYSFSYNQSDNIKAKTTRPFGSLIISYIAKHKGNKNRILEKISFMTFFEIAFLAPVYIFLIANINEIIRILFTEKWLFTAPLFQIFLLAELIKLPNALSINLLTGLGHPEILSKISIFNVLAMTLFLVLIVWLSNNIYFYAIVFSTIGTINAYIKSLYGLKKLGYTYIEFAKHSKLIHHLGYIFIYTGAILLIRYFFKDNFIMTDTIIFILLFITINYFFDSRNFYKSVEIIFGEKHIVSITYKKYKKGIL